MESKQEQEKFDHSKAGISDKIALVSELEHARRHAVRSAVAVWREEDDSESKRYLLLAKEAQRLRREYMKKHFGELKNPDWCLTKVAACIRQLAYEVCEGDSLELKELDDYVDELLEGALGVDLSDCEACSSDREEKDI